MGCFRNLIAIASFFLFISEVECKEKILIIGDSLTSGYGLSEDQSYPKLIEKKLRDNGFDIEILNGGVSGDTTAGGLRRLSWMLKNSSPNVLIIALGGNDMLRGLPPEKSEENILKMIEIARAESIEVWLLGIAAPTNMGNQYVREFDKIFKTVENKSKIPVMHNYIEAVAGKSGLNLADGIHPNQKGQELLAENILAFIRPLIKKRESKK